MRNIVINPNIHQSFKIKFVAVEQIVRKEQEFNLCSEISIKDNFKCNEVH